MNHNIASYLTQRAVDSPDQTALITPASRLNYTQLLSLTNAYAAAFSKAGIQKGMRTVVMLRPGQEFVATCFALLKMGAVMVLVDPGMGRQNLGKCLGEATPEAFVGIPLAHLGRALFGWAAQTLRIKLSIGAFGPGARVVRAAPETHDSSIQDEDVEPEDVAAIAFTSGSTGVPKGVVFTHAMFASQCRLLRDEYGIEPGEVDLATFPLFALFDPALRMTTVFPRMDFSRPGRVHPPEIVRAVRENGVTHMFGSPALLARLLEHYRDSPPRLPTLRRVLTAGAPVSVDTLRGFGRFLTEGEIFTPYGATEALPVSSIAASERLQLDRPGDMRGVCVGRPFQGVGVTIMRISDSSVSALTPELCLPRGEVGEVVVSGPNVSREYFGRPEANRLAKIWRGDGTLGHRMGDLGYFDQEGRVWFCGRRSHRVQTEQGILFSVVTEVYFNQHPDVRRTALVGVGEAPRQRPVLCVELPLRRALQRRRIRAELLELARKRPETSGIETILFHPNFPVDVRHNAKIFREKLAEWAAGRI